ncbi:MAG TPA: HPr family phosphocarrier protein [Rhizobiales bacterium]|nr:HPr family phosphocarrier protein [Hyphomicrobiales bacterium]
MTEDADKAQSRIMTIRNARGLHARASAKFVKCAENFTAQITVSRKGECVSATSIMGLLMLAAGPGCKISVSATGPDARAALQALNDLVDDRFAEE